MRRLRSRASQQFRVSGLSHGGAPGFLKDMAAGLAKRKKRKTERERERKKEKEKEPKRERGKKGLRKQKDCVGFQLRLVRKCIAVGICC